MAIITQITLPSGNTYDITDAGARALIQELMNYTAYLGVTTTELVDGVTTSPVISINGESVTAVAGNVATYETEEFIYASTGVWQKFAELSGLGALAHKDSASGSYTPGGDVSKPTFSGNSLTSTGTFTPDGECTGADVELNTTTVNSITDVGTLPSATMPTVSVTNETLVFTAGSFDAGTLPTKGADTTVATDVKTVTQPTFSGTAGSVSVTGTPSGDVSKPSFTGTTATITVS